MVRRNNKIRRVEALEYKKVETGVGADLEEALDVYLHDCKIRNLSEYTLKYYKKEILTVKKILDEQDIDFVPIRITTQIVKENIILYMLEAKKLKDVSVNTRLRALRAFFNFLYKESYIYTNPFDDVKLIKQKRSVVPTFTIEQLQALLRQPDLSTFTGVRDYTMILLFVETGMRVKELEGLAVSDVKWEDSMILIRDGKGYKERLVPIQAKMKKQLQSYLKVRGSVTDEDALFITLDYGPLSKRQIQSRISFYGKQADIKGVRCSPHTLRHTFAKLSVKGGAGIFQLQQILGHTSMEMVRRYVNLFSDDVKEQHRKFSPLKQL